jgi:hypothetical protein
MGPALVRGLVATAPATAGTSLLAVPLSRALRDDHVPEAYPGAPWTASMAAYLIQEAEKGAASAWAPYLATLPDAAALASEGGAASSSSSSDGGDAGMLSLSDVEVEEVQYAPAVAALRAYRGQGRRAYDDWRPAGESSHGRHHQGCEARRAGPCVTVEGMLVTP